SPNCKHCEMVRPRRELLGDVELYVTSVAPASLSQFPEQNLCFLAPGRGNVDMRHNVEPVTPSRRALRINGELQGQPLIVGAVVDESQRRSKFRSMLRILASMH